MNIQNITSYRDPAELLTDYGYDLTSEQAEAITGAVDFEPFAFFVVNNDRVICCDSINGDLISDQTLLEFYQHSIEYAREALDEEVDADLLIKAMAAAGYTYDNWESTEDNIRFFGELHTLQFDGWWDVESWLRNVDFDEIFDDPGIGDKVERIMRGEV